MAGTDPGRPGSGPSALGDALADILASAPDDVARDVAEQLERLRETIRHALNNAYSSWDEPALRAYLAAGGALHAVLAKRPVAGRDPDPAAFPPAASTPLPDPEVVQEQAAGQELAQGQDREPGQELARDQNQEPTLGQELARDQNQEPAPGQVLAQDQNQEPAQDRGRELALATEAERAAASGALAGSAVPGAEPEPPAPPGPSRELMDAPAGVDAAASGASARTENLPLVIDDALRAVWDELESHPRAKDYARAYLRVGLPADGTARARKRWEWLHLLCLRLPRQDARTLRDQAAAAVAAAVGRAAGALASTGDAEIPDLQEIGYAGTGCLHQRALPADLADVASQLEPRSAELRKFTAATLWLYEHDPLLREHERTRWDPALYQTDIRSSIGNLVHAQEEGDGWTELTRVTELDQKLRSAYPVPFPYRDSWWEDHLKRLGDSVTAHPHGNEIDGLKLVGQSFRISVNKHRVDQASAEVSPDEAGRAVGPGNMAWLLRLGYVARDRTSLPPLVVFVSRNS